MTVSRGRLVLAASSALLVSGMLPKRSQAQSEVVRIGTGFVEGQAQCYYAQDAGFFTNAGLTVQITQMRSGAAIAAAVASGDLQFGVGNALPLAQAYLRKVPLLIVGAGAFFDAAASTQFIVVAASSPIRNAKDLSNKLVAVSSLRGLDQLAASAWIDENGGDLTAVKFIELPQPAMAEALAQGRVAAAVLEDPEYTAAKSRITVLGNAFAAIAPRYYQSVWFSSTAFVTQSPAIVRKFVASIAQAGAWSEAHPNLAAPVLQKYLKVKADRTTLHFGRTLDAAMITPILKDGLKYGILSSAVTAQDLLWRG